MQFRHFLRGRSPRRARQGMITLEWIILVTVIIIGTIGAVAVVRSLRGRRGGGGVLRPGGLRQQGAGRGKGRRDGDAQMLAGVVGATCHDVLPRCVLHANAADGTPRHAAQPR